jgi:ABC-type transport system substrate-binding protein
MDRRPKAWLSLASLTVVATLAIAATGNAASPTSRAQESPSAAPQGTPYPSMAAQPPAPAEGWTQYPPADYGTVADDCSTFNNLPYGGNLKEMKATDDHTVVFTFCNPDVAFLAQIAFQALAIDDAGYLIANVGDAVGAGAILDKPNGTGPYMLDSWDKGNRMDLVANPNYWGTAPLTPKLEIQWSDQSAARLTALQAGSIDGMDNPGKGDIDTIKGDSNLNFFSREGLNTFYLGMNNTYKPWNNLKVRQAIAQGIDRQKIVDNYYPPGSSVADFFTPNAIPYANAGDAWWSFDAAAAKALLAEGLQEEGIDPAT